MKKILLTLLCLALVGFSSVSTRAMAGTLSAGANVPSFSSNTQLAQSVIPNFDHIILIVMENRNFGSVWGAFTTQMPLLNQLASNSVVLTNYHAVSHPSLPNMLVLMSGSTQGISTDCTNCFFNQPNLADEINASGRTWKTYLQGLPSACTIGDAGRYVQKHNPLLYFNSVRLNKGLCDSSIVPLTALDADLTNNQLPNFSLIIPDLCNSGHDCPAATADSWINGMVSKLQSSSALGSNYLIIITFDESSNSDHSSCCGLPSQAGGQVATVFISPTVLPEMSDNTPYDHYNLLKTILTAWNLPLLGETASSSVQAITTPWTGLP